MSDDVVSSKAFTLFDVTIESAVLLLELEGVSEYDDEEAHPEKLAVLVCNGVASIDGFSSSFTFDAINFSSVLHIEGAQQ